MDSAYASQTERRSVWGWLKTGRGDAACGRRRHMPASQREMRAQTELSATEHETHLALLFVHVDATICHSWSPDVCGRMTLIPRGTLSAHVRVTGGGEAGSVRLPSLHPET